MIKLALVMLATPMALSAHHKWVGPDCKISWDRNPAEELVQGYKVYITSDDDGSVSIDADVGNSNETTCSAQSLEQGKYMVYVTAYNSAGESDPSETLPFVLVTDVTTKPQNLSIESTKILVIISE